uniref:Uncharacterized protein n=1 Tax=Arundo donax TaxID=35708 RepID=A0A0A9AFQ7_ARUDO
MQTVLERGLTSTFFNVLIVISCFYYFAFSHSLLV